MLQFMLAVSSRSGAAASGMEVWSKVIFLAYVLCLVLYIWGTFHSDKMGKASITMMVGEEIKKIAWAKWGNT
ncbi:hypothetical protein [uncultured Desulfobacter sp.]|uniref:hypothetical protein n=1 Tax=uncultured Desulfobacter sp. TaxID=240139 RepID=UPI002AAA6AA2|nr:hypothetical protein [uncultured Desulfobacter sp.]